MLIVLRRTTKLLSHSLGHDFLKLPLLTLQNQPKLSRLSQTVYHCEPAVLVFIVAGNVCLLLTFFCKSYALIERIHLGHPNALRQRIEAPRTHRCPHSQAGTLETGQTTLTAEPMFERLTRWARELKIFELLTKEGQDQSRLRRTLRSIVVTKKEPQARVRALGVA